MKPIAFRVLAVLVALHVCAPLPAADKRTDVPEALKATITIDDTGDRKPPRSYVLTLHVGGGPARIHNGSTVPFESTTTMAPSSRKHSGTDKDIVPIVSYTYQNIGFVARLSARKAEAPNVVRILGEIEDSRVKKRKDGKPRGPAPDIVRFEHEFDALLVRGEGNVLVRVVEEDDTELIVRLKIE